MKVVHDEIEGQGGQQRACTVPSWITADLIADTIGTWQPYYAEELTEGEAVAILQSVGRLVDVLEYCP